MPFVSPTKESQFSDQRLWWKKIAGNAYFRVEELRKTCHSFLKAVYGEAVAASWLSFYKGYRVVECCTSPEYTIATCETQEGILHDYDILSEKFIGPKRYLWSRFHTDLEAAGQHVLDVVAHFAKYNIHFGNQAPCAPSEDEVRHPPTLPNTEETNTVASSSTTAQPEIGSANLLEEHQTEHSEPEVFLQKSEDEGWEIVDI